MMNMGHKACACAAAMLALQGCSSRPREFTPQLSIAPASKTRLDAAIAECKDLYIAGKLDSSGRSASAAAAVGAGATVAAGGAAAASGAGTLAGMGAIASATVVAIPIVVVAGALGMAKIKRSKKERAIQTALAGCLYERGYEVVGWSRAATNAS